MEFDLVYLEMRLCDFLVDGVEVLEDICVAVYDLFALVGKLCLHVVLEMIDAVQDFSGLFQPLIQDLGLGVDVILEVLYLFL